MIPGITGIVQAGLIENILVEIDASCRVIIPDQRGYNLSDKPKDVKSYDVYTLVEDIVGLIDALEYEKVNLVGHDWGAVVAWVLASKYPDRLHKLSIMNIPHPAVMRRFLLRDFEQMRRSWYVFFFQLPWLPETVFRANNWRSAERARINIDKQLEACGWTVQRIHKPIFTHRSAPHLHSHWRPDTGGSVTGFSTRS